MSGARIAVRGRAGIAVRGGGLGLRGEESDSQ